MRQRRRYRGRRVHDYEPGEEAAAEAEHEVWYVGAGDLEHGERDGQFSAALLGCGCDVNVEALGADHFTVVVVESFPDEYTLRGAVRRKNLMASIAQNLRWRRLTRSSGITQGCAVISTSGLHPGLA
jgi:hypothetical protein